MAALGWPQQASATPHRLLLPGLYAEAELGLDQKANVPVVPVQALDHEGNKTAVFVVGADHHLQQREVQLGLQTSSEAEITSGLQEKEQVVVSDCNGLKPGQKVHPQTVAVLEYHEPAFSSEIHIAFNFL